MHCQTTNMMPSQITKGYEMAANLRQIHLWRDAHGNAHTNLPHHYVRHSPDGFEWGYGGSGPAELALNVLMHVTEDGEVAERLYMEFKDEVIANIPHEGMTLTTSFVQQWVDGLNAEQVKKE